MTAFRSSSDVIARVTVVAFAFGVAACEVGDDPQPLSHMVAVEGTVDYTIAAGTSFYIDRSYSVGHLTVNGRLLCQPGVTTPITITATSITVTGDGATLECGTATQRYDGAIKFLLRDDGSSATGHAGHAHDGPATLSVSDGGTLRLFGGRIETFGWQRIAAPIAPGATTVVLESAAGWRAGDTIVVGPTGFNSAEAEERTIARVAGTTVTVTAPFTYGHLATNKLYTEGARSAVLHEHAEVADLTRNIVISAAADDATLRSTQRGASVVIRAGGHAFVDGVELAHGGQLGVLGAYPFHWHLAGDVPGQYLRNSSIHHTFQRCVTIHGTNYAEVSNNVCFDHLGHGFFFEQGNEVKNVLHDNLGMLSRRVPAGKGLLDSDMHSDQPTRFSAPSTFWVTNPDNDLANNVASGSEGTGFWMSFSQGIHCGTAVSPYQCDGPMGAANNLAPAQVDTLRFDNNIAHSTVVGMTWDGAEDGPLSTIAPNNPSARKAISSHYYHGAAIPSFDRLQAWKNVATGFYFRGEPATFTRLLAADNGQSLFFAYDQRVVGGLVIGNSGTITAADVAYTQSLWPDVRLWRLAGALIYDGPFELRDVHFADFVALTADVPATPFYNIGGANRKIDRVTHVTFDGTAASRVVLWGDRLWADTPWATALRDDGSLSGAPGLLVPDHPMNASTGDCSRVTPNVAARGLLCRYDMGILQFSGSVFAPPYDAIRVPIRFERIERATGAIVSSDALAATELTNKAALIEGLRYTYRLSLSQPDARAMLIQWWWQPENGEPSPMLEIDGVARYNCHPSTASRQADSLAALDLATTTTYRYENGNLYMRLGPGVDSLKCDAPAQLATLGAP